MTNEPEKNPLYSAYDRQTSPSKADREQAALEKAVARGHGPTGAPAQQIAQLEARLRTIEALLKRIHGKNGIKVSLPIISFTGKEGALRLEDLPTLTLDVSVQGEIFEMDVVVISSRVVE